MGLAGHFYCIGAQSLSGTTKTAVDQKRPQSKVYLAIVWYCFVICDKMQRKHPGENHRRQNCRLARFFVTDAYFLEHANERILSCSDYPDFSLSSYGIHDINLINRVH